MLRVGDSVEPPAPVAGAAFIDEDEGQMNGSTSLWANSFLSIAPCP